MEKPFVKSLTAVAVGAGAIAICLFCYHINNQRQHQQRINYAESAITNQKDTLTSLSKEVDKLYSTKEKNFLNITLSFLVSFRLMLLIISGSVCI